jgi:hypothetical protein
MAKRKERPVPRWRQRAAAAQTPADQFAAASDRLRAAAKHMQRPQRDPAARRMDSERAAELLGIAADYVNGLAAAIERGDYNHKEGCAA